MKVGVVSSEPFNASFRESFCTLYKDLREFRANQINYGKIFAFVADKFILKSVPGSVSHNGLVLQ